MADLKQDQTSPSRVECPAAKDPAVRLFILSAILIGFGAWCFVEAYIAKKYVRTDTFNDAVNYYFNHLGGILMPLLGLIPLVWGIVFLRRRLVADEEGIGYVGQDKIPWSAARALDASKLADKGILTFSYQAEGEEDRLVLDSWKLQNFRELALLVERKVARKS